MSEVRLGPEDAGRTVTAAAGDRLVLALPETPGTGYTWQVEELPAGARVVDERCEQSSSSGIGGQARRIIVLEAGDGGALRLRRARPWLGEEGVNERYEVTTVVAR